MNYEQPIDVMALDAEYNLVAIVVYNKLQWNRKCLEAGIFSIELTIEQYDNSWQYIYSPQRRELGRISQVNLSINKGTTIVTVSGRFIEEELDKMVVYPKPTNEYSPSKPHTSIVNGPQWLSQDGTADEVALAFFRAFKTITYMGYDVEDTEGQTLKERTYALDILEGTVDTDHGEYHESSHNRNGEYLGHKISKILKFSHAYFQVNYNRDTNEKTFDIVHGRDLTSGNTEGNNPVVFSSQNGTIVKANIVKSDTETKDIGVSIQETYVDGDDTEVIVLVNGKNDATGRFLKVDGVAMLSDYPDDHDFRLATLKDIANYLNDTEDKLNLSFDVFDGSYNYVEDFDLGDVVSVVIPEIGIDADVQIVGCYETTQNGVWSLNLEFGTPLKNRR